MQVAFHIGAHCTDDTQLLRCLLTNEAMLAEQGIVVPRPRRFRPILREVDAALQGTEPTQEMRETVLDALMDEDKPRRVVLSNHNFLASPAKVLARDELYARAGERCRWLRRMFPDAEAEFFLAVRNPATFLPALFAQVKEASFDGFLGGTDPRQLRWSDVVRRIREAAPEARLTVWCNEDTPLIWPDILRRLSGVPDETELEGTDEFLATIMTEAGTARMRDYLASHPPANEEQRRRIVAAFLDKFAIPEEIEMELDVPGWTADMVEEITETYEEDVLSIERIEEVEFIAP